MSKKYESPLCKGCPAGRTELSENLRAMVKEDSRTQRDAGRLACDILIEANCRGPQKAGWGEPDAFDVTRIPEACRNARLDEAASIVTKYQTAEVA